MHWLTMHHPYTQLPNDMNHKVETAVEDEDDIITNDEPMSQATMVLRIRPSIPVSRINAACNSTATA